MNYHLEASDEHVWRGKHTAADSCDIGITQEKIG